MSLEMNKLRVMLEYIGDEQFLQIHMNLLKAAGAGPFGQDLLILPWC